MTSSDNFAKFFIIFMQHTCKCMKTQDFLPVYTFNAIKCCNSCYKRICYMVSAIVHGPLKLYFLIKQHPKLNKEHPETSFRRCGCSFSNPRLEFTFYFPLGVFMSRHTNSTVQLFELLSSTEMLGSGLMFQFQSSPT